MTVIITLRFHANDVIRLTEKFSWITSRPNALESSVSGEEMEGKIEGWWNMWIKQSFKISFY